MALLLLDKETEKFFEERKGNDEDETIQAAYSNLTYNTVEFKLPWIVDGHHIIGFNDGEHVKESDKTFGHEISHKVDIAEVVADFYLLEAIASGVLTTHLHDGTKPMSYNWRLLNAMFKAGMANKRNKEQTPLDTLMQDALGSFAQHVTENADPFLLYSHYAIMTEARYSPRIKRAIYRDNPDRFAAMWMKIIDHFGGHQTVTWAAELFRNSDYGAWKSGYGGEPWAIAADVVAMYEAGQCNGLPFTEREFLDRVFSLQHNNATFLDKWSWGDKLPNGGNLWKLGDLLEAHKESLWIRLANNATDRVAYMWGGYLSLAGETLEYGYSHKVQTGYHYQGNIKPITSGAVKVMPSVFVGKCKTSGNVINKGDMIVWHGKGKGASLQTEWDNK